MSGLLNLSHGALANAWCLVSKTKLWLLEEPTHGLAPVILEQLSLELEKLRNYTDFSVLQAEQNVTFALTHAVKDYILKHARIIWEGTTDKFVTEMEHIYL